MEVAEPKGSSRPRGCRTVDAPVAAGGGALAETETHRRHDEAAVQTGSIVLSFPLLTIGQSGAIGGMCS